ncbi:MAG TPA: hypothetical protein IAC40_08745 [Candidatus Faecivivens stercorigallinarum]|nr:hypothetical protein [Candidatus Faecivivens stercorigallinarum]
MKKSFWISLIAGVAAVAAVAVAIAALIRRKTEAIAQELDFEPDDDYFDLSDEQEEDEGEELSDELGEEVEEEISTSSHEEPIDVPGDDEKENS